MMVITAKYLIPKGYAAIALYPFIVVHSKHLCKNPVLLNHERIHLKQQAELLVLPFYIWYTLEYCLKLIKYKNRRRAYRAISFEREAYKNENNLNYLTARKSYTFLKYL